MSPAVAHEPLSRPMVARSVIPGIVLGALAAAVLVVVGVGSGALLGAPRDPRPSLASGDCPIEAGYEVLDEFDAMLAVAGTGGTDLLSECGN